MVTEVYLDDGYAPDSGKWMCLAGYSYNYNVGKKFGDEWISVVKDLPGYTLHTTDFLAGRRQYKDLQMPHADRIQLLQKLVGVINTYMDFGYIVSVDTVALQEVAKQLRPILSDDERASMEKNAFCLLNLLRLVFNSGVQHDGVSVLVDDSGKSMNTYGAYRTVKARYPHWRDHLSAITFGDDRWIQGLQAADMLANAVTRDYRRATEPGPVCAPTLQELFDVRGGSRIRYVADHWKRERLEDLARFMMSSHSADTPV